MATNIVIGNTVESNNVANNTPPKGTSYYLDIKGRVNFFNISDTPISNFCSQGNSASTVRIGGNDVIKETVKFISFGNDYSSITRIPGNFLRSFANVFEVDMFYMSNINIIGSGILLSGNSLKSVKFSVLPPELRLNAFLYTRKLKYIYVPRDYVEDYKIAPGWVDFLDKIRPIYF